MDAGKLISELPSLVRSSGEQRGSHAVLGLSSSPPAAGIASPTQVLERIESGGFTVERVALSDELLASNGLHSLLRISLSEDRMKPLAAAYKLVGPLSAAEQLWLLHRALDAISIEVGKPSENQLLLTPFVARSAAATARTAMKLAERLTDQLRRRAVRMLGLRSRTLLRHGMEVGLVRCAFAPQDDESKAALRAVAGRWTLTGSDESAVDLLRRSYGGGLAAYFIFLSHYTAWLPVLALIGLVAWAGISGRAEWWAATVHAALPQTDSGQPPIPFALKLGQALTILSVPSLSITMAVALWSALVVKSWARREARLGVKWRSHDRLRLVVPPRAGYTARPWLSQWLPSLFPPAKFRNPATNSDVERENLCLSSVRRTVVSATLIFIIIASFAGLAAITSAAAIDAEYWGKAVLQGAPSTAVAAAAATDDDDSNAVWWWPGWLVRLIAAHLRRVPACVSLEAAEQDGVPRVGRITSHTLGVRLLGPDLFDQLQQAAMAILSQWPLCSLPVGAVHVLSKLPTGLWAVGRGRLRAVARWIVRHFVYLANPVTDESYQRWCVSLFAAAEIVAELALPAYVCFVEQDMHMLTNRLRTLFFVQLLGNLVEVAQPFVVNIVARTRASNSVKKADATEPAQGGVTKEAERTLAESRMPSSHMAEFDDMCEIVVQMLQVVCWTPVFPLAPLFALINNVVEGRVDAFKRLAMTRATPNLEPGLKAWRTMLLITISVGVLVSAGVHLVALFQMEASLAAAVSHDLRTQLLRQMATSPPSVAAVTQRMSLFWARIATSMPFIGKALLSVQLAVMPASGEVSSPLATPRWDPFTAFCLTSSVPVALVVLVLVEHVTIGLQLAVHSLIPSRPVEVAVFKRGAEVAAMFVGRRAGDDSPTPETPQIGQPASEAVAAAAATAASALAAAVVDDESLASTSSASGPTSASPGPIPLPHIPERGANQPSTPAHSTPPAMADRRMSPPLSSGLRHRHHRRPRWTSQPSSLAASEASSVASGRPRWHRPADWPVGKHRSEDLLELLARLQDFPPDSAERQAVLAEVRQLVGRPRVVLDLGES